MARQGSLKLSYVPCIARAFVFDLSSHLNTTDGYFARLYGIATLADWWSG